MRAPSGSGTPFPVTLYIVLAGIRVLVEAAPLFGVSRLRGVGTGVERVDTLPGGLSNWTYSSNTYSDCQKCNLLKYYVV